HKVEPNTLLLYTIHALNRDPAVFKEPDKLEPFRWLQASDPAKIWTYGGGARECLGRYLAADILMIVGKSLLTHYEWKLNEPVAATRTLSGRFASWAMTKEKATTSNESKEREYKWVPVARAKQHCIAVFSARTPA
ncbi:hypothetical protein CYMTET_29866, partial [Cymbomonas tetramitiformis]